MRKQPLLAIMSATLIFTVVGSAGRHHLASAEAESASLAGAGPATAYRTSAPGVSRRPTSDLAMLGSLGARVLPGGAHLGRLAAEVNEARRLRPREAVVRGDAARAHRSAAYQPPGGVWLALRRCESGDDYTMDSGNGYYGAYQFSISTWEGIGFPGLPSEAPAAVQDRAAQVLEGRRGWSPWPVCSFYLGLR